MQPEALNLVIFLVVSEDDIFDVGLIDLALDVALDIVGTGDDQVLANEDCSSEPFPLLAVTFE